MAPERKASKAKTVACNHFWFWLTVIVLGLWAWHAYFLG